MYDQENTYFFRISITGKKIEIECHDKMVFRRCRGYLAKFDSPDFLINVSAEELEAEASNLPPIEEHYEGVATGRDYAQIEGVIIQRKIAEKLLSCDTFLMHGSTLAFENQAYMFTAPSGIGKTTRSKIWLQLYPESFIINDDKPFIKITDTQVLACGSPWCGKEGLNRNTIVPLKAIFLLERADEEEDDSIKEMSFAEAFPILLQQTYRPVGLTAISKTIQLLKAMDGKVKLYKLRSHPTGESIRLAYETASL